MNLVLQLAPLVILIGGIVVCGCIFVSLKREIHALFQRLQEQHREIQNLEQRTGAQLDDVRTGLREADERSGVLVPPSPPRSGLNLNKRSQVLRMSRHGENESNIAAALSLPRKEVELLLKVQKIVLINSAVNATF